MDYLRRLVSGAVTMADSSSESAPESEGVRNRRGNGNSAESSMEKKILSAISGLNEKLSKQCKRMDEQDNILQEVAGRLDAFDDAWAHAAADDPPTVEEFEGFSASHGPDGTDVVASGSVVGVKDGGSKRVLPVDVSEAGHGEFAQLTKRFMFTEACDPDLPTVLADTVKGLFTKGLPDEQYEEILASESNNRPANCVDLAVVKVNQMIWDALPASARARDKKCQKLEASVVTASKILVKALAKFATLDKVDAGVYAKDTFVEECGTALALLGQSNKQINALRKDLLRPELKSEYKHLCNVSTPVSVLLFGDDVSKTAKEIEECAKITNKMFTGGFVRPRVGRLARFRVAYAAARGRGRSQGYGFYGRGQGYTSSGYSSYQSRAGSSSGSGSKNSRGYPRRARPYKQ